MSERTATAALDAAAAYRAVAALTAAVGDGMCTDPGLLAGCWSGPAADAATDAAEELRSWTQTLSGLVDDAATALRRHATRILGAPTDEANRHGWRARRELEQLAAEVTLLTLDLRVRLGATAHTAPPGGAAAAQVHAWWTGLPGAIRSALVAEHPAEIGAIAGLPVSVRSAANERVLARDLAALQVRRQEPSSVRATRRAMAVRASAEQLDLARRDGSAYLLAYDPDFGEGEGRTAIVLGDAATAEHVAVLVPGMGASVGGSLGSLAAAAARLRTAAEQDAPGERTAVVAWLGYDAPQPALVASVLPALLGARLLAADVDGLVAGRRTDPHVTVVGHSYGSTTAPAGRTDAVDDLVLMGSPGVVEGPTAGRTWVLADSRDPVTWLQWFGPDPAADGSTATRVEAQSAGPGPLLQVDRHSRYLEPGSESLHGVSHVVVGDLDEVRTAPARPSGLWWDDPEARRDGQTWRFDSAGRDVRVD